MKMRILGIGAVGGFGAGIDAFRAALEAGGTPSLSHIISTPEGPITVPGLTADTARLGDFIPLRALRRVDHHTRMALLACRLALQDAGAGEAPEGMGIVVGTGYGSTCNTFDIEGFCADDDIQQFSPIQFSNSVHNAAGAHIAAHLKVRGPNITLNQFDLSPAAALRTAGEWLAEGRVERVLVGCVDNFARIMAYHRHCRGSGRESPSAVIGEGSVFFMLGREGESGEAGYGLIQDARVESGPPPVFPAGNPCIVGADGLSPGEAGYGSMTPGEAAVYSPVYGNMPSGMAFDIAAAALGIRAGALFASAQAAPSPRRGPAPIQNSRPTGDRPIHCLKIGSAGGWGVVTLGAG